MSDKTFVVGGRYNWRNQPERLIYLGLNPSGNGRWHQFAKVDAPSIVWCEVPIGDLHYFEESAPSPVAPDILVARLRECATEIARAGHNGWGNACTDAADRIERVEQWQRELIAAAHKTADHLEAAESRLARITQIADKLRYECVAWEIAGNLVRDYDAIRHTTEG